MLVVFDWWRKIAWGEVKVAQREGGRERGRREREAVGDAAFGHDIVKPEGLLWLLVPRRIYHNKISAHVTNLSFCLSLSVCLSVYLSFCMKIWKLKNGGWCNWFHMGFRLCWHTNVAACCLRHVYSQTLRLPIKVFCDKRTLVTVGQWLTSQEWKRKYEVKLDWIQFWVMWDFDCPHILELICLWKKKDCCSDYINEHLNYSPSTGW